jgi:hypothetical protein
MIYIDSTRDIKKFCQDFGRKLRVETYLLLLLTSVSFHQIFIPTESLLQIGVTKRTDLTFFPTIKFYDSLHLKEK